MLYDALVEADALAFAANAQRFFVGKRAGRPAIRQEEINRLMIRAAHRGQRVVRLKCGDPFVFGRGGEEALALAAAGVPCEVVPGVIERALPHRCSPAFRSLIAGSRRRSSSSPGTRSRPTDRSSRRSRPAARRVVVLMGLGESRRDPATLLDAGWSPRTPGGDPLGASRPGARSVARNARQPRGRRDASQSDLPGIIVVGAVVGLAGSSRRARSPEHSIPGGRAASTAR